MIDPVPPSKYEIAWHLWFGVLLVIGFVAGVVMVAHLLVGSWLGAILAVAAVLAVLFLPPFLIQRYL